MEFIQGLVDFILHIDVHLTMITSQYGTHSYAILFAIVFAETGLVVTPFLPGDTLLFAAGAICSLGTLDPVFLCFLLIVAAILGDGVNYAIGQRFGRKLFSSTTSKLFNRVHLERTHAFYEKYGGKTIIIARFMPIIRTFAPFVAGIGEMSYRRFLLYNVVGAVVWVVTFVVLGFVFGNQPLVEENFTLVIGVLILLSILPAVLEIIRTRKEL
ncbi:MAG: DedA family protein [Ignavibacteria bacterium]|nr:DedA family protein [Ignavibacteria bacterium]